MVYIGSMNLDPRSESTNTELGLLAECPELAKEVIRVDQHQQAAELLSAAHSPLMAKAWNGWRRMIEGEVVLSEEPEVTPLMRL